MATSQDLQKFFNNGNGSADNANASTGAGAGDSSGPGASGSTVASSSSSCKKRKSISHAKDSLELRKSKMSKQKKPSGREGERNDKEPETRDLDREDDDSPDDDDEEEAGIDGMEVEAEEEFIEFPLVSLSQKHEYLIKTKKDIDEGKIVFSARKENFGLKQLDQLFSVSKDEIKGYPCIGFNEYNDNIKFGIKVIPFEDKYDERKHPCNLEIKFLKEFYSVIEKKESPHITCYFTHLRARNKSRALFKFPLKKLRREIYPHCCILIAEYVTGGSVEEWYKETSDIPVIQWKYVIFSVLWTLMVLQDKYRFMHNDCHYGNILVDTAIDPEQKCYAQYDLKNPFSPDQSLSFYVPNVGLVPKLWDFEFSSAFKNIPDMYFNVFCEDEENIPDYFTPYYDVHNFMTSLLELRIPEEVEQFIRSVYPTDLIPEPIEDDSGSEYSSSDSYYSSDEGSEDDSGSEYSRSAYGSDSEYDDDDDSESEDERRTQYLLEDRMINGVEKQFPNLPTPRTLLSHGFFDEFRRRPASTAETPVVQNYSYTLTERHEDPASSKKSKKGKEKDAAVGKKKK